MTDLYTKLEELNKEKQEILRSKEYKRGKAWVKFVDDCKHLRFGSIYKTFRDKKASITIRKKYTVHKNIAPVTYTETVTDQRIAVYTCVVGGYDGIQVPVCEFENVDHYLFTDRPEAYEKYADVYKIVAVPEEILAKGNILANRYLKFHPGEFLPEYDYTIYVDGNVRAVSDIRKLVTKCSKKTGIAMHTHRERDCIYDEAIVCKLYHRGNPADMQKQVAKYAEEQFPAHFGMNEATVIVCDNKNTTAAELLHKWWEEFVASGSNRDQIAWPYVLWKNGYTIEDIGNLGSDIYQNYILEMVSHR